MTDEERDQLVQDHFLFKMGDRFTLNMVLQHPSIAIEQAVQVVWVNAKPSAGSGLQAGVGVAFVDLGEERRLQIKAIVHNRLDELAR